MLKVGLTGNMGSGKTLVADLFRRLGVPVFHADMEAKALYQRKEVLAEIRAVCGPEILDHEGHLDRKKMAELIFSNPLILHEVNMIIHPKVRSEYQKWTSTLGDAPYSIYEAAILFESGHYQSMDRIICVTAPEELRIERVAKRDGVPPEAIKQRIAHQWEENRKAALADFVIVNDGTLLLIPQVLSIHQELIHL
jgi:dephospho-CoA kinase